MKLPCLATAERLLQEGEARNPGAWVAHSRHVALAARCLAEHHPELEPKAAFIMGLLHDIGRQDGSRNMDHTLDGYRFLMALGYPDAARICLTHSFPFQDIRAALGNWECSEEDYQFVKDFVANTTFDTYDRLLQLCDALAMAEGICLMEKRLVDAVRRHGFNDFTLKKWQAYFEIQREFEAALDRSIYKVLPGVVETTFGFQI
jgi:hypothetical protein